MNELGRIRPVRRDGSERFGDGDRELGFDALSFWQWSASDLVSNATRGVPAESLEGQAIGAAGAVRDGWAPYDLLDPRGGSIEVKSAAFIQSWHQRTYSRIRFSCSETQAWDPDTNRWDADRHRQAEVYVFCLLAHKDQATLDPLNLPQWEFYALSTRKLATEVGTAKSLSLARLGALHGPAVAFRDLAGAIGGAADVRPGASSQSNARRR